MTTTAERRQALTAVARNGQDAIDGAWTVFTTAVRDSPDTAVGAWIAYRTAAKAVAADYPHLLPATPAPGWPSDDEYRALVAEYDSLSGMAPNIARGTVDGVAANAFTREITAAEVAAYHRRADAYHQAYARWEQRRIDYVLWHLLLTPAERDELGPDGDYRARVRDMAEREQAYRDRCGQSATPGAHPANEHGFTKPAPCPQQASPVQRSTRPLRIPGSVDSFDAALTTALG